MSKQSKLFAIGTAVLVAMGAARVEAQCTLPAWGAGPPVGTDLYGASVTNAGGAIYSAGGYSFSGGGTTTLFQRYDVGANTWTTLAPLPTAMALGTLASDPVGNRLFLFGGTPDGAVASGVVQVYSIATDTWSAGPALPDTRELMGGGTLGNVIYLVAGYSTGQVTDSQNQNWLFDPGAGTYTPKAVLPAALGGAGSAVVGGKIYIMGGRDGVTSQLNTNFGYDPGTDTWATLAVVPTAVNVPAGAGLSGDGCTGRVFLAGGGNPFLHGLAAPRRAEHILTTGIVQLYDPGTDSWATGPALPVGRSFASATQAGDTLLVIGGYDGGTTVNTVNRIQGAPLPVGLSGFSIE
jgi:N-acetylneuraminic acid mutarotase